VQTGEDEDINRIADEFLVGWRFKFRQDWIGPWLKRPMAAFDCCIFAKRGYRCGNQFQANRQG
jgi:hypothetical protein